MYAKQLLSFEEEEGGLKTDVTAATPRAHLTTQCCPTYYDY